MEDKYTDFEVLLDFNRSEAVAA